MKLVGIMPVRNEDWILGLSLRVALKWCDQVIVGFHSSNDVSQEIAAEIDSLGFLLHFMNCYGTWDEMIHRQAMLSAARVLGATHVAIIDADEVLTANLVPLIRDYVERTPQGQMLDLPLYNLRQVQKTIVRPEWMQYHSNGVWGNRWIATAFQDRPELHWGGDRFHHREPMGTTWRQYRPVNQGDGGVLHFWGASERRLRAKHALYRVTERLRWPDKPAVDIEGLYSLATSPREPWAFKVVRPEWLEGHEDLMQYLHIDREPWQEQEVRRMVQEHGVQKFHGLDLLGMV